MKLLEHGELSALDTMYPSILKVSSEIETIDAVSTVYGYVLRGRVDVVHGESRHSLREGSYFSGSDLKIDSSAGSVATIIRLGFRGQFVVGSVERKGRLSYIDGCSDSMLVYPPRKGDPVFNHLHFPGGIVQTQHTHPSIRLGIVIRGEGEAFGPGWTIPLVSGSAFILEEQELHSFRTKPGVPMDVLAYHPDSDWGPVDGDHPMLNRTYIGNGSFSST